MIQKKVCMLGAYAVGKTSLVERYVKSIFSDAYLTTVGVKIEKKEVQVDDRTVKLIIWDIHGEDRFQSVEASYLRGSAGCFLVIDGTRRHTLDAAIELFGRATSTIGDVPAIALVNKADLRRTWEVDDEALTSLEARGLQVLLTSAKTGEGVEDAFLALARAVT